MSTPILMLCLGGQKTSLLAKTLYLGGMSLGNDATWWNHKKDYASHTEYAEITRMMAVYNRIPPDLKEVGEMITRLREILRSYKTQAEEKNWKYYGIKTTAGICSNKWDVTKQTYFEEWPDALYFSLIRKPMLKGEGVNEGWGNVHRARKELAETRNAVFLPYPEVYITREIQKFVQALGLTWNEESMNLFHSKKYREGSRAISDPKMQGEYEHLLELGRKNFYNLFGETLSLEGV